MGEFARERQMRGPPDCVVHGPEGEEGQRVQPHHDDDEEDVQDDTHKANDELRVEQEHGLVLPRTVQPCGFRFHEFFTQFN